MLGLETQYRLRDFFQTMASLELRIENQRQRLATLEEFEPYSAFCRINRDGNKKVTAFEIMNFLQ